MKRSDHEQEQARIVWGQLYKRMRAAWLLAILGASGSKA